MMPVAFWVFVVALVFIVALAVLDTINGAIKRRGSK